MSTVFQTNSKSIDLLNPDVESIVLDDIALAIARIARYNGHTKRVYSVAEHSWLIYEYLRDHGGSLEEQLIALLHDAREAYIGDLTYPFIQAMHKICPGSDVSIGFLAAFNSIGAAIDVAIYKSLGVEHLLLPNFQAEHRRIKRLDLRILMTERLRLFQYWIPWELDKTPFKPLPIEIEARQEKDSAHWSNTWLFAVRHTLRMLKERAEDFEGEDTTTVRYVLRGEATLIPHGDSEPPQSNEP